MASKRKSDTVSSVQKKERRRKTTVVKEEEPIEEYEDARFLGEPVPDDEARRRWPHRYRNQAADLSKVITPFVN